MTANYYLIYRVSHDTAGGLQAIDWTEPTGGIEDFALLKQSEVYDVARTRYHCGPHEDLILAQVWGEEEVWQAHLLHEAWELEMRDFIQLMA
jgi:hypothetical protein